MMQLVKTINQIVYFLLEMGMLIALGYGGFQSVRHVVWKYVLAFGFPILAATLWGILAAPRSPHRLPLPYRVLFALVFFGVTTFALYRSGHTRLAIAFGFTALMSQSLAVLLKE